MNDITIPYEQEQYFKKIEESENIKLTIGQKRWYTHQKSILGDKIFQEYPSTISEAFLSTSDAYYFQLAIEKAYTEKRCLSTPLYDALDPVYVAMDIGVNDLTVMTFFQVVHGEIRVIDYYEDNNKGVDFYCNFLLNDKNYIYHTIFLPHDAARRDGIVVENTYERDFKRLFRHTNTRILVLPRTDKNLNISNAKIKLDRCIFAIGKVNPLLVQCSKYRKKWSEMYGKYLDEPYHDISSNYADSLIYAMQAVTHIESAGSIAGAYEKHRKAVESRRYRI